MSRVSSALARAREDGRTALIVYVCAGDPSLEVTEALIPRLAEAGADVVELGVPFSDPLADGPTIQAASQRALEHGTSPAKVLDCVRKVRGQGCEVPLVLMGYLNPLVARGVGRFCSEAARVGVDGLIVPDLPLDEADEVGGPALQHGLDLILLAAPTTPADRLRRIAERTRGFLYFVSVTGVTGARGDLPAELPAQLKAAREASSAPVAVGFGVSSPEQAARLAQHADAVIVGSALVKTLAESNGDLEPALRLVRSLSAALRMAGANS
jgi:tryptophan synthase alpha chain